MRPLTFYAGSLPHFCDFLAPLFEKFPGDKDFFARGRAAKRAANLGIPFYEGTPPRGPLTVVASYEDYRAVYPNQVVLVNHGVGQTYNGDLEDTHAFDHPSYSGGRDRDRVVLFLCPSERDAEINRANYPQARSVATGPHKLDPWLPAKEWPRWEKPIVCISFHADIHVCKETQWAYPHYAQVLPQIAESDRITLVGHGHPRMKVLMEKTWAKLKVPFIEHFSEVLDTADVYVCDNSSTLYEFAATGRPVVVMNSPSYRRNVHHGLRFWDAIPGIETNSADELAPAIWLAAEDPAPARDKRHHALQVAYGHHLLDGKATERAVAALVELAEADTPAP